jgi:hypothetical protein
MSASLGNIPLTTNTARVRANRCVIVVDGAESGEVLRERLREGLSET